MVFETYEVISIAPTWRSKRFALLQGSMLRIVVTLHYLLGIVDGKR